MGKWCVLAFTRLHPRFSGKGELRLHFILSKILTCCGLLGGRGSWKMTWVNVFVTVFHLIRFPRLFPTIREFIGGGSKNVRVLTLVRAWIGKTRTLHVHHAFLYIPFPSVHDYDLKTPNFTFCGGREHKTTTFCFFFWTLIQSWLFVHKALDEFSTGWKIWPDTLFTRNCRTVIFSSKASNNTSRKSMFARIHAATPLPFKNLGGHGVHTLPFKFSTVSVKNLTSILAFKFLNGAPFKFSYS